MGVGGTTEQKPHTHTHTHTPNQTNNTETNEKLKATVKTRAKTDSPLVRVQRAEIRKIHCSLCLVKLKKQNNNIPSPTDLHVMCTYQERKCTAQQKSKCNHVHNNHNITEKVICLSLNIYNFLAMDATLFVFYSVCLPTGCLTLGQLRFGNAESLRHWSRAHQ